MGPLGARRIQVHPCDAGRGEPQRDEVLELLGPEPPHSLGLRAALAAGERDRLLVAAVVTAQRGGRLVDREGDGAVRTLAHVAARRTLEERGEPPPVEPQDLLTAAGPRVS